MLHLEHKTFKVYMYNLPGDLQVWRCGWRTVTDAVSTIHRDLDVQQRVFVRQFHQLNAVLLSAGTSWTNFCRCRRTDLLMIARSTEKQSQKTSRSVTGSNSLTYSADFQNSCTTRRSIKFLTNCIIQHGNCTQKKCQRNVIMNKKIRYRCQTARHLCMKISSTQNTIRSTAFHDVLLRAALWWMTAIYWPDFFTFTYPSPM